MSVHVHTLRRSQRLPGSPEDVFAFFGDARNLESITPPLLRFRVMEPAHIVMGAGALIRYRLRVHRVPVGWLTAIREWDPPHRFVDEQLHGPYALWHHTHTFEPLPDGGTLMHDEVRYALPFGPLGELARRLFVARDLEAIFDYRADRIGALHEIGAPRSATPYPHAS
jgi:ligand-binding SRPBCC domain-containing protein